MKTLIITGGTIEDSFAVPFIEKLKPDHILGIDRGLEFCLRAGIRPHQIIGDFDSLSPDVLAEYKKTDIPIRTFNPIKDATDTCIALDHAISIGSSEIWILGATGTRLDHFLCNLQTLKKAFLSRIPAYIVDAHNLITIPVEQDFALAREAQFGDNVSFFPLDEDIPSLTLRGFFYPLEDHPLRGIDGLGVSNRITSDTAFVSYRGGTLVMMQTKD